LSAWPVPCPGGAWCRCLIPLCLLLKFCALGLAIALRFLWDGCLSLSRGVSVAVPEQAELTVPRRPFELRICAFEHRVCLPAGL